jgi:hypothetical protein
MLCCIAGNGWCTLEVLWRYKDNDKSMSGTRATTALVCIMRLRDRHAESLWVSLHFNRAKPILVFLAEFLLFKHLF